MKQKKGITLAMLVIIVVIMSILAATITTSVLTSINNTKLSIWTQEIMYVQDIMNETINKEDALLNEVNFSVENIDEDIRNDQFADENIVDNAITFYSINLAKINLDNTVYGKYEKENDIYVYSKTTGKVYYLAGMKQSSNQIYYTLTDELKNKYNEQPTVTEDISYVVFKPSSVENTTTPVTVLVRVPTKYTNISVTTSDTNVVVGTGTTNGNMYEYQVNTSNVGVNYRVIVKYNDGTESKVATYDVSVYTGS